MYRKMRLTFGIILICVLAIGTDAAGWGYEHETGPDHWADLFPHACAGQSQSPIDIRTEETVYDPSLKDFAIFFDPPAPGSKFYVHNNGHSIQVNTEGKFYVSNGGLQNIYSTAQFHFHWGHKNHHGSEHTLDGVAAPIELHIVNWNSDVYSSISEAAVEPGGLAVLGMLFDVSNEDNPIFEPLVNVLKHVRDPDTKIKAEIPAVSMRAFLPRAPDRYYRYNGSLTTPGCFESVVWTVFDQKLTISKRQLQVFRQVLKPTHHRKRRSTMHESRAVKEFFGELGIEDNEAEKARLKRQLTEKASSHTDHMNHNQDPEVVAIVEESGQPLPSETPKHEHHDTRHTGHPTHAAKSHTEAPHIHTHTNNTKQSHAEQVRQMLVNNYRPVQPLNGRTVYRSFPFLDEPITSDTEVVYIETSQQQGGTATCIRAMSLSVFICSVLIAIFL